MAEWFEVNYDTIKPLQVEKFTDSSIWVNGRRRSRSGGYPCFPTWDAAYAYLLDRAESVLAEARRRLQGAQGFHGRIVGMRKPEQSA